ncbi:hypothetical protein BH18ACT13_BH18ACT13_16200 [soil metagenome]
MAATRTTPMPGATTGKKCSVCAKRLKRDRFARNSTHRSGHQSGCKACQKLQTIARPS